MKLPIIFKGRITPRGVLLPLIVIAPVATYVSMFGWAMSNNHARWSEFGTFMAGVYSPIIGVFTLMILRGQFKLQRRQFIEQQQQIQKQVYESQIERAVEEINFFVDRLEKQFAKDASAENSFEQVITRLFQTDSMDVLNSDEFREKASIFDRQHPKIMPTWGAIHINTAFLSMLENQAGEMAYLSCNHKLIAVFSYEVCAVLDNYHYAVTRGELSTKYEFSTPLENR